MTSLLLLITTLLLSVGCTSQQAANTENVDDDEIALEDYVDSELPNFSGDVSSAIFGDTTGYDVHIEVKIANKSKDKNEKPQHSNQQPEIYPSSPKNHLKAKKILDLIIEKLKHKKDDKEKGGDGSDIDIEESDDVQLAVKGKAKDEDEISDPVDDEESEQEAEAAARKTDEFAIDTKSNSKEAFPAKTKHKILSVKTKAQSPTSADGHPKTQHSFDITKASKSARNEDTFSFPVKGANSQHMPQTSTLTHDDDIPTKSRKSNKKAEKLHADKPAAIMAGQYANDEIRVKVPKFLNKSLIFTRILKMIEEDKKKAESVQLSQSHVDRKSQSKSFNPAKQNSLDVEQKSPNISLPFYKFLLLKKLHKDEDMSNIHDLNSQQHLPTDAIDRKEIASRKVPFHHMSNINNVDLPAKGLEQGAKKKKDQDEIKKPDVSSNFSQDNSIEPLPEFPGVPMNSMEESSEKLRESKDESERDKGEVNEGAKHDEKAKPHERKNTTDQLNDLSRNDAFVPNRFASKSFQENLEPEEIGDKIKSSVKPSEKKMLDAEEVHIEEVDSHDKTPISPQRFVSKSLIKEEHKLEAPTSTNLLGVHDKEEIVEARVNPARLFNDSLFQQAGITVLDGNEMTKKNEKIKFSTESPGANANNIAYHGAIFQLVPLAKQAEKYNIPTSIHVGSADNTLHPPREKLHGRMEEQTPYHLTEGKHDISHKAVENSHHKLQSFLGGKSDELNEHEKGERPEAITSEKYTTLNNPLPSVLFREILNTDDGLSKMATTSKKSSNRGEDPMENVKSSVAKDLLEDGESIAKAKESDEAKESTQEGAGVTEDRDLSTKQSKDDITTESKGDVKDEKAAFDDLESIQLDGKDSIDAGSEDESEATGDEEYEDASGANNQSTEDKSAEHKREEDKTIEPNLRGANEAIWKASEDIHALLHSLTDRAHADRVLGNLKQFIREKHGYDQGKKRNKVDLLHHNTTALKREMNIQIPDRKTKILKEKDTNVIPNMLQLKKSIIPRELEEKLNDLKKKKSEIPGLAERKKRGNANLPYRSYQTYNTTGEKRHIISYDKYTNHTGHGIDRLYSEFAAANSRTPPTFADDKDGWSSEEIRNVLTQLKSSQLDLGEAGNVNNLNTLRPDYQEFGMTSQFTGYHQPEQQSIGLPQNNQHAVEIQPLKELMNYQKELQTEMQQNKMVGKLQSMRAGRASIKQVSSIR